MTRRPYAWERSYPATMSWDAPVVTSTLPALIAASVDKYAMRTAIEYGGRAISYAELGAAIDRTAAACLRDGSGSGVTIALYLPNSPYHPIAFFGGLKAGARLVHLSPLDAERELAHKLHDSGARIVFTTNHASLLGKALKLLEAGHIDRLIVGDDAVWALPPVPLAEIPQKPEITEWSAFVENAHIPAAWPKLSKHDVALLQYTGGTTGMPKGAMLSHANLTASISIYDNWFHGQGRERREAERIIGVLPLFHIYALTTVLLRHLHNGNEILLRPRFDAEQTLRDIEVRRANGLAGVPTMWIALSNLPGIETRDFSSLRYAGSGGAPLPVEVGERFRRLTGLNLRGGWGMTETSPAGTNLLFDGPGKLGSIGLPMPGVEMDIASLEDPRIVLAPGEVGELRIKGPNVTSGYWNRPVETEAAFVDGFFLTGDIGYMDEDGYFFIVDRRKDMIISGGFNVYPQVIEQAVYEHPQVEEALVVGIADPYRGEAAKVFAKLRQGADGFTLEDLQAFLADKVGRHEMPIALEFRPALPRTAVGKLSKTELREEEREKARAQAEAVSSNTH